MELTQHCREGEQLSLQNLAQYLLTTSPEFMENKTLIVNQFSAGASNLTYDLSNGQQHLILRRPPLGNKAKSAHDMVREYHLLCALHPLYPLAPKPILLCEHPSILGCDFFVMEKMSGLSIDKNLPHPTTSQQNARFCENYVARLIQLHSLDITQQPLLSLGKPEGYVERQLTGWYQRYNNVKTPDVPNCEDIFNWLTANLPLHSDNAAFIHNDYKFDNLLVTKQLEIVGILDWEMATLGDPLLDLGCSLAYWVEANDDKSLHALRMMPTHLPGMFSRQQIFDHYCHQRNLKNQTLTPYYVFGLFRLAAIAQQIYYRFYQGQTNNPKFKSLGMYVSILLNTAQQQIITID